VELLAVISPLIDAFAVFESVQELALVPIAQESFISTWPYHDTLSVFFTFDVRPLVYSTVSKLVSTTAMPLAIQPLTSVLLAVRVSKGSLAGSLVSRILPNILLTGRPCVRAVTIFQIVSPFPAVGRVVGNSDRSRAMSLVLLEVSLVDCSIWVNLFSSAILEIVDPFTVVSDSVRVLLPAIAVALIT